MGGEGMGGKRWEEGMGWRDEEGIKGGGGGGVHGGP